jgi:hypothetical protein
MDSPRWDQVKCGTEILLLFQIHANASTALVGFVAPPVSYHPLILLTNHFNRMVSGSTAAKLANHPTCTQIKIRWTGESESHAMVYSIK